MLGDFKKWFTVYGACLFALLPGCAGGSEAALDNAEASWAALLDDGDVSSVSPAAASRPPPAPLPQRSCPADDCSRVPLASWTFDDCNALSTELEDSSFNSQIRHPAFRSVSVACAPGVQNQAVRLSTSDDIVYAPDQPDFVFDHGLTFAAWINPEHLAGTQSILRKRLDGSSSFALAIDGKRLNFVLRLNKGRVFGVSAPIQAGRFTHVAATYDGQEAVLYLDGAPAARARAAGTIAAGSGPIFIGNDADGRRFRGVVDEVWLNNLAAPADAVRGLTCLPRAPVIAMSPGVTTPTPPLTPVTFDLSITNPSSASCQPSAYVFFPTALPAGWTADPLYGFVTLLPGETAHARIDVAASESTSPGAVPLQFVVGDTSNFSFQAATEVTFVVGPAVPTIPTGCASASPRPVAPGGYYVNGNTVCTADGRAHLFHGVDRASLEWTSVGVNLRRSDFQLMGLWNPNVVRVPLNQDFWIAESPLYDPEYASLVDSVIRWAEMAGMDVILDLHWSDAGVLGGCVATDTSGCQQLMPDRNSVTFWRQVAARYKNDGRVMFELYNEPHDVNWDVWKSGGETGSGWQAAGMQELYDTVRSTGAENLVFIGGLNWAYDLSGVPSHRIDGHNIVYATHPYKVPGGDDRLPQFWGHFWGFLTRTDPVVATEFGEITEACSTDSPATDYPAEFIRYADEHAAGWTSWWWWPDGCLRLIDDWKGTPSALGTLVKGALLGYSDPPASPPLPGGGGPDVNYTFDAGKEGWVFSTYNSPPPTNLSVMPPAGVPAPKLSFEGADGDPSTGALKVSVTFTDVDQYVDALVGFEPDLDLSGKALHARVRLVSGGFAGAVFFHASTGAFIYGSTFFGASDFPIGEWVPLTFDLGTVTEPGYDPAHVVQIGLTFHSGFAGTPFESSGETVFEIDTVTD